MIRVNIKIKKKKNIYQKMRNIKRNLKQIMNQNEILLQMMITSPKPQKIESQSNLMKKINHSIHLILIKILLRWNMIS